MSKNKDVVFVAARRGCGCDGTGGGWVDDVWQGVGFLARLLLYTAAAATEYVTPRSENCAVPPRGRRAEFSPRSRPTRVYSYRRRRRLTRARYRTCVPIYIIIICTTYIRKYY